MPLLCKALIRSTALCRIPELFSPCRDWTGLHPPRLAASILPPTPGIAVGRERPSCRECRASLGMTSAVTVVSRILAGPVSTWASCCALSAPVSTGTVCVCVCARYVPPASDGLQAPAENGGALLMTDWDGCTESCCLLWYL